MDERCKPKWRGGAVLAVMLFLPLLLLLYVASSGPAMALATRQQPPHDAYFTYYSPVEKFAARGGWFYRALRRYQKMCGSGYKPVCQGATNQFMDITQLPDYREPPD